MSQIQCANVCGIKSEGQKILSRQICERYIAYRVLFEFQLMSNRNKNENNLISLFEASKNVKSAIIEY